MKKVFSLAVLVLFLAGVAVAQDGTTTTQNSTKTECSKDLKSKKFQKKKCCPKTDSTSNVAPVKKKKAAKRKAQTN